MRFRVLLHNIYNTDHPVTPSVYEEVLVQCKNILNTRFRNEVSDSKHSGNGRRKRRKTKIFFVRAPHQSAAHKPIHRVTKIGTTTTTKRPPTTTTLLTTTTVPTTESSTSASTPATVNFTSNAPRLVSSLMKGYFAINYFFVTKHETSLYARGRLDTEQDQSQVGETDYSPI